MGGGGVTSAPAHPCPAAVAAVATCRLCLGHSLHVRARRSPCAAWGLAPMVRLGHRQGLSGISWPASLRPRLPIIAFGVSQRGIPGTAEANLEGQDTPQGCGRLGHTIWGQALEVSGRPRENGGNGGKWGEMGGNGGKWGGNGELLHVHHGKCMKMFQEERKMEENGGKLVRNGTCSGNFPIFPDPICPKADKSFLRGPLQKFSLQVSGGKTGGIPGLRTSPEYRRLQRVVWCIDNLPQKKKGRGLHMPLPRKKCKSFVRKYGTVGFVRQYFSASATALRRRSSWRSSSCAEGQQRRLGARKRLSLRVGGQGGSRATAAARSRGLCRRSRRPWPRSAASCTRSGTPPWRSCPPCSG